MFGISFLPQVVGCYWEDAKTVPQQIIELLEQHASVMQPELRRDLCRSVMLMRTKDTVAAIRYDTVVK